MGFQIQQGGVAVDPDKVRAISDFPRPTNITELRSFMGLVEQLAGFSTEVAAAKGRLRPLLFARNAFIWTEDHDSVFDAVKAALTAPPILTQIWKRPSKWMLPASRGWVTLYSSATDRFGSWWMPIPVGVPTPSQDTP